MSTALNTVSTDDAYVNGHMTLVAPRVSGEVANVLVDDNMRVKKGELLIQLDKEPFQVQVALKRAAVAIAEANLTAAESTARSLQATANSQRWKIRTASQLVKNQVSLLKARVAILRTSDANVEKARGDYERGKQRAKTPGAVAKEELDRRLQQLRVAEAGVDKAREDIFQVRASLGLPPEPGNSKYLDDVPPDLDETFSDVRAALSDLVQTMTQLGVPAGANRRNTQAKRSLTSDGCMGTKTSIQYSATSSPMSPPCCKPRHSWCRRDMTSNKPSSIFVIATSSARSTAR